MTRRSGTQRLRRRGASRKNQALRRWLVRFVAQPDDRGQQWWEDFDALLRRTRMRLRPIDAGVARFVLDTNIISQILRRNAPALMLRRGVPIAYVSKQLGHSSIQITVDLYGHFIPGADRHHVEGLAEAIEEAGRQLDATQPQPDPISKNHTEP